MPGQTMTAIRIAGGKGPAAALHPETVARPQPGPGQILIAVRAAGVNRPDIAQRKGNYPPPPGAPEGLGLEVAGEVAAVGPGAGRWRVGDAVTALLGGGGYAQYAAVDARHALPVPPGLDFVQAAALPETVFTVFSNLFEIGDLKAGETVLVHGATSGIGVAAIQLAKARGATVIATSRTARKAEQAKTLGADISIDVSAGDFVERVKAARGADVVLEMVAGDYVAKNIEVLKPFGRLVFIAFQAGSRVELDLMPVQRKRLVLTGSMLRPRDADEKARLAAAVEAQVWPLIASGAFRPIIDSTFPLERAADAHAYLEAGDHLGKVVLTV
ncbi:MAG: quinone oxidoreductase, family [Caulobacteraceae bacterium]|nr:quinone oxidoreductase, family [Caulobacteraceae bacterium]